MVQHTANDQNTTVSDPDTSVPAPSAIIQLVDYVPLPKMLSAVDTSGIFQKSGQVTAFTIMDFSPQSQSNVCRSLRAGQKNLVFRFMMRSLFNHFRYIMSRYPVCKGSHCRRGPLSFIGLETMAFGLEAVASGSETVVFGSFFEPRSDQWQMGNNFAKQWYFGHSPVLCGIYP